jgi:zinc transporter ZupT
VPQVLGDSIEQVATSSFKQPLVKTITYLAFFVGVLLCSGLEWLTDALMRLVSRYRSSKSGSRSGSSDSLDNLQAASAAAANPPPASRRRGDKCDVEAGPTPVLVTAGSIELCTEDGMPADAVDTAVLEAAAKLTDSDCGHLARTCILVWLALSLHNLPEGLATFVG